MGITRNAEFKSVVSLGPSMEYLFRGGDLLLVDEAAKANPSRIVPGDVIVFLGGSAKPEIAAHRVWLRWGDVFITKGDGNWWFDAPVRRQQLLGLAALASREGVGAVELCTAKARAAGFFFAFISFLAKLACLLSGCAARFALRLLSRPSRWFYRAGAADWQGFADAGNSLDAFFSRAAGPCFRALAVSPAQAYEGPRAYAGELRGNTVWEGVVAVRGDIVVPRGSALTVKAGTRVLFSGGKVYTRKFARAREGGFQDFTDGSACRIYVEGVLNILGSSEQPVLLGAGGGWKGIVISGNGKGYFRDSVFEDWAGPLSLFDRAELKAERCRLSVSSGTDGIICAGASRANVSACSCSGARRAFCALDGAVLDISGAELHHCGTGIFASGFARVRASNIKTDLTVASPAELFGRSRLRLSCSTLADPACAVRAEDSALSGISRARISRASETAITSCGAGMAVRNTVLEDCNAGIRAIASKTAVRGSHLRGCRKAAFEISGGRALLSGTRVEGSLSGAVVLGGGAEISVRDCELLNGGGAAFYASDGCRAELRGGRLDGNAEGIVLSGSYADINGTVFNASSGRHLALDASQAVFRGARLSKSRQGIVCAAKSRLAVEKCGIDECGREGVLLVGESELSGEGLIVAKCAGQGLSLSGGARAALKLFEASECGAGVVLQEKSRANLEGGKLLACARGVYAASGSELAASAFDCRKCGVAVLGESGAHLRFNGLSCFDSASDSLWLRGAAELDGINLQLSGSGLRAAFIQEKSALRGHGFEATGQSVAVWAEGGAAVRLKEGRVSASSERGFFADSGSFLALSGLIVSGAGGQGLHSQGGSSAELDGCSFTGCGIGISLLGGRSRVRGGLVSDCIKLCLSFSGGEHEADGILLSGSPAGLGLYEGAKVNIGAVKSRNCACGAHICASSVLTGGQIEAEACKTGFHSDSGASVRLEKITVLKAAGVGLKISGGAKVEAGLVSASGCGCGVACEEKAGFSCASLKAEDNGDGLRVEGGSSAVCLSGAVASSRSRGAHVCGGSSLSFHGVQLLDNAAQGVRGEDSAVSLSACAVRGGVTGISVTGGALAVSDTVFSDSVEAGISLSGGKHELRGIEFSGGKIGLGLYGSAAASCAGTLNFKSCATGLNLCAASSLKLEKADFSHCGVGARVEDGARLDGAGISAAESRECGLSLMTGGRARLGFVRAAGCALGVQCRDKSLLEADALSLQGNRTGMSLDTQSVAECGGGEIGRSRDRGVVLKGQSGLRFERVRFDSNSEQGVFAEDGCSISLSSCTVSGSAVGVSLSGCDSEMSACALTDNGQAGLSVSGGKHKLSLLALERNVLGLGLYGGAKAELHGLEASGCAETLRVSGADLRGSGWRISSPLALCAENSAAVVSENCYIAAHGPNAAVARNDAFIKLDGLAVSGASEAALSVGAGGQCYVSGAEISACGLGADAHSAELEFKDCRFEKLKGGALRLSSTSAQADGCVFNGCDAVAAAAGSEFVSAGCSYFGADTAVRVNGGSELESSHDLFRDCACGVSVENASHAKIVGTEFAVLSRCALRLDGGSRADTENCRFLRNRVSVLCEDNAEYSSKSDEFANSDCGLRLNNGAGGRLAGSTVAKHSFAGVHLAGAALEAEDCGFYGNSMAVFADCASKAALRSCEFSGNRTGVKADNEASVEAVSSRFSGSRWDAVWCAGGSVLKLEDCAFRDNRYGIKEDGPCRVSVSGGRFEGSHSATHLRYPR
ncbi:MAG: hypothetical protein GX410_02740 [Elusimicrobia bacterium]|nr:hypothetical protein [Elusimicrobiota bacterium]